MAGRDHELRGGERNITHTAPNIKNSHARSDSRREQRAPRNGREEAGLQR
jgi:hypothetical protein